MNSLPVIASAMLVLLTITPYTTEAKVFEKCELATILLPIVRDLNYTNPVELISKVICHFNSTTGLNSSAVTPVQRPPPPTTPPRRTKTTRRFRHHDKRSRSSSSSSEKRDQPENTLLGLFQLPSKIVCKDGKDLCHLECSKLTDDDITDDIDCGKALLQLKEESSDDNDDDQPSFFECFDTNVTSYLSDCQL